MTAPSAAMRANWMREAAREIIGAIPVYDDDWNVIGTLGEVGVVNPGTVALVAAIIAKHAPPADAAVREALEKVADALEYTLPMAKGYAHAHPVGGNQVKIDGAEEALEAYRAALAAGPVEATVAVPVDVMDEVRSFLKVEHYRVGYSDLQERISDLLDEALGRPEPGR